MSAPPDVLWHEDGFSIELGRLRRPRGIERRSRHVWALTIPLYLLVLAVEVSFLGSAFVLGTALVLFARQAMWLDERRLRVAQWELRIGRRRIGADTIVGCDVRGHSLVVRTTGATWPLGVGGLSEPERRWLKEQVLALRDRWRDRDGAVPQSIRAVAGAVERQS